MNTRVDSRGTKVLGWIRAVVMSGALALIVREPYGHCSRYHFHCHQRVANVESVFVMCSSRPLKCAA